MPSYTHKMAIVSLPQILSRHFALCIFKLRLDCTHFEQLFVGVVEVVAVQFVDELRCAYTHTHTHTPYASHT